MVAQCLRLLSSNTRGLGSTPGQGTRSHMLQLKIQVPQLRPKDRAQPNKYIFKLKRF